MDDPSSAVTEAGAQCPFCEVTPERIRHHAASAIGIRDAFPVSPGHTLVIPIRHVSDWWSTTREERLELLELVDSIKGELDQEHCPTGYNVGFNQGASAGQTVFHLHLHVIPRYDGDVADPIGAA